MHTPKAGASGKIDADIDVKAKKPGFGGMFKFGGKGKGVC